MAKKRKIKMTIDFLMTVLLLILMAYQITGQKLHEWFGAGMLILFIVHNILNIRWYGVLFKGRYKTLRIVQTIVNFAVLASMLCLAFSGIVLSRYVFAPLDIHGPMATARSMHLSASYWGFVLMSTHLGMHWGQILGMFRGILKGKKVSTVMVWAFRFLAMAIAVYGLYCFVHKDIFSYMFLKNDFVFFDFEQGIFSVFVENAAMMGLWVCVGYYASKGIVKVTSL